MIHEFFQQDDVAAHAANNLVATIRSMSRARKMSGSLRLLVPSIWHHVTYLWECLKDVCGNSVNTEDDRKESWDTQYEQFLDDLAQFVVVTCLWVGECFHLRWYVVISHRLLM